MASSTAADCPARPITRRTCAGWRTTSKPATRRGVSDTAAQAADRTPARRPGRSRRTPEASERLRDAERTRARILDAALAEFADKGYAGARVRQIAERAGVNAQLISYYFGGKEGLYRELVQRWHSWEAGIDQAGLSFADVNVAYL